MCCRSTAAKAVSKSLYMHLVRRAGCEARARLGQGAMTLTPGSQNRIMIYGPKADGTYLIEFKTTAGEALAISVAERRDYGAQLFPRADAIRASTGNVCFAVLQRC